MSRGWTKARHRKEAKEDVSEKALAPAHHHAWPLQHLPLAAQWPGRQGAASLVNLSPGEEWHSWCTRLSPSQQQHTHGMVLTGLVVAAHCDRKVRRHRAAPCLCSCPSVTPAGFSSSQLLARTPPCLAVGEKCAHCHLTLCNVLQQQRRTSSHGICLALL